MQANPVVSIIIPSFNRASVIGRTLHCVLSQSYSNWECIIVDDGSTDHTNDRVNEFVMNDPRFILIKRERLPKGASTCRNIGLKAAKGELILFLDSDDVLLKSCLQERVSCFSKPENQKYDFLVFATGLYNKNGDVVNMHPHNTSDHLSLFLLHRIPWTIMGGFWKLNSLISLGGFNESFNRLQDVELHTRAILSKLDYYDFRELPPNVVYVQDSTKYSDPSFISKHLDAEKKFFQYFADKVDLPYVKYLRIRLKNVIVYRAVFIGHLYDKAFDVLYLANNLGFISKLDYLLLHLFIKFSKKGFLKLNGTGTLWTYILGIRKLHY